MFDCVEIKYRGDVLRSIDKYVLDKKLTFVASKNDLKHVHMRVYHAFESSIE